MKTLLCFLCISLLCTQGHTGDYFTWYDAQGRLHITEQPPPADGRIVNTTGPDKPARGPDFQKMKFPPASGKPSFKNKTVSSKTSGADSLKIRIERERLLERILYHEKMKNRSSSELGISKSSSAISRNNRMRENYSLHHNKCIEYQNRLSELRKNSAYYFKKYNSLKPLEK